MVEAVRSKTAIEKIVELSGVPIYMKQPEVHICADSKPQIIFESPPGKEKDLAELLAAYVSAEISSKEESGLITLSFGGKAKYCIGTLPGYVVIQQAAENQDASSCSRLYESIVKDFDAVYSMPVTTG